MQDSSTPTAGQADKQQLLERIDRLEALLRSQQRDLGRQLDALQGRLARWGLDTQEKIAQALEATGPSDLRQEQAPPPHPPLGIGPGAEPVLRATATRRMGRMV